MWFPCTSYIRSTGMRLDSLIFYFLVPVVAWERGCNGDTFFFFSVEVPKRVNMVMHRVSPFGWRVRPPLIAPFFWVCCCIGFLFLLACLPLIPPPPRIVMDVSGFHVLVGVFVRPSLTASGGKGRVRHVPPAAAECEFEEVSPLWGRGQGGDVTSNGQRTSGKPSHRCLLLVSEQRQALSWCFVLASEGKPSHDVCFVLTSKDKASHDVCFVLASEGKLLPWSLFLLQGGGLALMMFFHDRRRSRSWRFATRECGFLFYTGVFFVSHTGVFFASWRTSFSSFTDVLISVFAPKAATVLREPLVNMTKYCW